MIVFLSQFLLKKASKVKFVETKEEEGPQLKAVVKDAYEVLSVR